MPQETLGQRLKRARLAAGLEQEDAARHVDRHRNTIGRWESDDGRGPSETELTKLAQLYGTTVAGLHGEGSFGVRERSYARYRSEIPVPARAFVHRFLAHLAESDVSEVEIDRVRHVMFELASYLSESGLMFTDAVIVEELKRLARIVTESLAARGEPRSSHRLLDLIQELRKAAYPDEFVETRNAKLTDLDVRRRERASPTAAVPTKRVKRGRQR